VNNSQVIITVNHYHPIKQKDQNIQFKIMAQGYGSIAITSENDELLQNGKSSGHQGEQPQCLAQCEITLVGGSLRNLAILCHLLGRLQE
jgi:hypothetical protein